MKPNIVSFDLLDYGDEGFLQLKMSEDTKPEHLIAGASILIEAFLNGGYNKDDTFEMIRGYVDRVRSERIQ